MTDPQHRSIGGLWAALATACALVVAAAGLANPSLARERGEQERDDHSRCERDGQASAELERERGECQLQPGGNWWPEFRSTPDRRGVYVGSSAITPANAPDLTPVWRSPPTGAGIFSSPAVANVSGGIAYVGSLDGSLHAFNATTGVPLWANGVGSVFGGVMSSPVVANGVVYMGGGDFRVHAFNATTGAPVWTAVTGGPVVSSPTVVNGVVYAGSDDKKVYALNAGTGALVWSVNIGSAVRSSPAVANGVVYAASRNGILYALNAISGATVWIRTIGSTTSSSPAVANGLVYIGSDDLLAAFDIRTGTRVWTAATGPTSFSSPAVANGLVYVGSLGHRVWALNASNGGLVWSADVGAPVVSSPALVNGVLFVGSDNGFLYAYNAVTGTQLWSSHTGLAVQSSPAVANNMVYVGSLDHSLYAFAATDDWPMFHHSPTVTGDNGVETTISPANVGTLVTDWTWTCPPTGCAYVQDPAVADGVVYAGVKANGASGGSLAAFDAATGAQLWTTPLTPSGDINGAPAVWNGTVYVPGTNQRLYAFDAAKGLQLWATPKFGGPVDPPTVQNGLVYAVVSGGLKAGLHALDPITGGSIWAAAIPGGSVPLQAAAVANGIVYVGGDPTFSNQVFAYDAITGASLWSMPGGVDRSAAVANGIVYWGDSTGNLRAFDAISGKKMWTAATAATAGNTGSSPAVSSGLIYVGAFNKVYALRSTGVLAWSTTIAGLTGSSPAVANGVVFVCSVGLTTAVGIVHALEALTGTELWSATIPDGTEFSSPVVAHGVIYVGGAIAGLGGGSGLYAFHLP